MIAILTAMYVTGKKGWRLGVVVGVSGAVIIIGSQELNKMLTPILGPVAAVLVAILTASVAGVLLVIPLSRLLKTREEFRASLATDDALQLP